MSGSLTRCRCLPSDGGRDADDNPTHPRATGTFARILGHYVREQKVLSLPDALRRVTIEPARRLEARVPEMRDRGRLRVGAFADITVFDPATVTDRSSYTNAAAYSEGILHVIVNGVPVVRQGNLETHGTLQGQRIVVGSRVPGRPIRAPRSRLRVRGGEHIRGTDTENAENFWGNTIRGKSGGRGGAERFVGCVGELTCRLAMAGAASTHITQVSLLSHVRTLGHTPSFEPFVPRPPRLPRMPEKKDFRVLRFFPRILVPSEDPVPHRGPRDILQEVHVTRTRS